MGRLTSNLQLPKGPITSYLVNHNVASAEHKNHREQWGRIVIGCEVTQIMGQLKN